MLLSIEGTFGSFTCKSAIIPTKELYAETAANLPSFQQKSFMLGTPAPASHFLSPL
jgi:hypothetical protein